MNRVIEIDRDNLLCVVQSGAINTELKAAVAEHGLWYPPDLASAAWSTVGGNVATKRRRAVVPEIRRHSRLRAGGCGRWPAGRVLAEIERIAARHGVQIASITHACDGNRHPLLVTPPRDDAARKAAQAASKSCWPRPSLWAAP